MGLFLSTWSRAPALDAYLNQLDLEVKQGFGSDQKPSVLLFSSWSIQVFLAVKCMQCRGSMAAGRACPVCAESLSSRLLGFWG